MVTETNNEDFLYYCSLPNKEVFFKDKDRELAERFIDRCLDRLDYYSRKTVSHPFIVNAIETASIDFLGNLFTANSNRTYITRELDLNDKFKLKIDTLNLNQKDLQTLDIVISNLQFNKICIFNKKNINNFERNFVHDSIMRMSSCEIDIIRKAESNEPRVYFQIFDKVSYDNRGNYFVCINLDFLEIYNKTRNSFTDRLHDYKTIGKNELDLWLYNYVSRYESVPAITFNMFMNMCKTKHNIPDNFRKDFIKSLNVLKKNKYIHDYKIDMDTVHIHKVQQKPSYNLTTNIKSKKFFITSIQNNTDYREDVVNNIMVFCKEVNAELIILKNRYATPEKRATFPTEFEQYYCEQDVKLADNLILCGKLPKLITNVNPFSGLGACRGENSMIVNHPTLYVHSEPVSKNAFPKMMYSIGSITEFNSVKNTLAAYKAEEYHKLGGLLVEVGEKDWFAFQVEINPDTNQMCHLDMSIKDGKVSYGNRVNTLTFGDIHFDTLEKVIMDNLWFNEHSLVKLLNPQYQFLHDCLDFRPRNHHDTKNHYENLRKYYNGNDSVKDEIKRFSQFLNSIANTSGEINVVSSNHDLALEKWVKNDLWENDYVNSRYHTYCSNKIKAAIEKNNRNYYLLEDLCYNDFNVNKGIIFLRENDSKIINGRQYAEHAHNRVAPANKATHGHTHKVRIMRNHANGGLSGSFDQGYNKGCQAWTHSHITEYMNGGTAALTQKTDGKFRA